MSKNTQHSLLFFLVIATILPKWITGWMYFDSPILVNTIFNFKDLQYFPIIKSFSELTFNPSYLNHLNENKLLTFPIYSILIHSLLFKIIGIYSLVTLEFFFQLIFLLVFFKVINKIFDNLIYSLYFCITLFLIISLLELFLILDYSKYLELLFGPLDANLGSRFPRPLFTGIFYFYFFYILFSFKEKLEKFDLKYFIIVVFVLSVLLNSFFYYFVNFSLLLLLLLFIYLKIPFFEFLNIQKKNIILVILSFILLSFPFLFQLYFGETDYSDRLGVISVDLNQKIYLLKYYFLNLLRIESLLLLSLCFLTHYFLNKKYDYLTNQILNINLFYYFILVSIFAPPVFFIFSPNLVSIYHFLEILKFSIIFYLIISLNFFLNIKVFFKYNLLFKAILILFVFFSNIYIAKKIYKENSIFVEETQKVQNYLQNQKLIDTKKKLFTNDLNIMNLWLFNKNDQLIVSDGFTNSLKNKDIEFNLIHSLKDFGLSGEQLKNFLSLEKSEVRNDLLMRLFIYRYQANSLYTFSELSNYTIDIRDTITNTSPFRAQMQIMPEDEKEKLIKLFDNIKIEKKLTSDLIILNKTDKFYNFNINNKKYNQVYSGKVYDIFLFD